LSNRGLRRELIDFEPNQPHLENGIDNHSQLQKRSVGEQAKPVLLLV